MRKTQIKVGSLIAVLIMIAFIGIVCADTGVPAVPEIQGISTGTSSNVQGTVTETDSGAWTLTNDPVELYTLTGEFQFSILMEKQLEAAGGSYNPPVVIIPSSLLEQPIVGQGGQTWGDWIAIVAPGATETISAGGLHSGV